MILVRTGVSLDDGGSFCQSLLMVCWHQRSCLLDCDSVILVNILSTCTFYIVYDDVPNSKMMRHFSKLCHWNFYIWPFFLRLCFHFYNQRLLQILIYKSFILYVFGVKNRRFEILFVIVYCKVIIKRYMHCYLYL